MCSFQALKKKEEEGLPTVPEAGIISTPDPLTRNNGKSCLFFAKFRRQNIQFQGLVNVHRKWNRKSENPV